MLSNIEAILKSNAEFPFPPFDPRDGVCLYGAGELGKLAIEYCMLCGYPIIAIFDKKHPKSIISFSKTYCSQSLENIQSLTERFPLLVCVSTHYFKDIVEELYCYGAKNIYPFYNITGQTNLPHPLNSGWSLGVVTSKEIDVAMTVCKNFSDKLSLLHYEEFLGWHRNNAESRLPITRPMIENRYIIPELLNYFQSKTICFIDIGAHQGESLSRVMRGGIIIGSAHLFEPDKYNREILNNKFQSIIKKLPSIVVYEDVLGEIQGNTGFIEGLGYCSQVSQINIDSSMKKTKTLDQFSLAPDYIKIHTEGTEIEVLRGAKVTIKQNRPVVALSCYHRRQNFSNDMYEIINSLYNYRFLFRNHAYMGTGSYLYCIPNHE